MATWLKRYYEIVKPGIIYGNAIPAIAGFLLASHDRFTFGLFIAMLIGLSLVIASGCVFNNYIDRDIDTKMTRTKNRALVLGQISARASVVYATILGLIGFAVLALHVNAIATIVAAVGFVFYVFLYSLWGKRKSVWGTVVGSVSGAVPPVVGYVAVSGKIDLAAVILFAIMVAWQMPHFFAIAIRRKDEYAAANIPVAPVVQGLRSTKWQMFFYILAFTIIAPLLTVFGYLGYAYFVVALALGLIWLGMCVKGFKISDENVANNNAWAKRMFLFSLVVMMVLFVTIGLASVV